MSDQEPESLVHLRALCPMRRRELEVEGMPVNLWTACDLDPLLNRMMDLDPSDPAIADERMPYWAELWPSSRLMAEVMVRHAPRLPPSPFLELGCGPALASVMAARHGCWGFATDYLEEARWLARANLESNQVADRVEAAPLDWRAPASLRFPWILAGDVIYESRNFEPLLHCWTRMLTPGGQVWLAEPGRSIAKPFFHLLAEEGWETEVIGQRERIRLYRVTRCRA